MRANKSYIAAILICLPMIAFCQSAQLSDKHTKAQQLLIDYEKNSRRGKADLQVLGSIYAHGLSSNAANINSIRRLLSASRSPVEKTYLVKILGSLHHRRNTPDQNLHIARDIKEQVYSSDRGLALEALLTYSRLGFYRDTRELLDYGLASRLFDEDVYAQELVIGLPFAPQDAQFAIALRLKQLNNDFAAQVMALTLNDPRLIQRLSPATRSLILDTLRSSEPAMPLAIGHYGINDGGRYADWLDTIARLTVAGGNGSYLDVVLMHLDDKKIDPRKILGYLTSSDGKHLMRSVGRRDLFNKSAGRALDYSAQFPGHPNIGPMAADLEGVLVSLRD